MYPNRRIVLAPGAPVSPDTVRRLAPPFRHPQPPLGHKGGATYAGRTAISRDRTASFALVRFTMSLSPPPGSLIRYMFG